MKIYKFIILSLLLSNTLIADLNKNFNTANKRQELLEIEKNIDNFNSIKLDTQSKKTQSSVSNKRFYIKQIIIENETMLPGLQKQLQKYTPKKLTINDIYTIIHIINNYYLSNGFSTTLVNLEKIDLDNGKLIFKIYYGLVNKIYVNNILDTYKAKINIPIKSRDKFNIIRLDQALENIKNSSYEVTASIVPSTKPGYSDIYIYEKHKKLNLSVGVDNSGNDNNGFLSSNLNLTVNDLLGVSDTLSFIQVHRFLNLEANSENTYAVNYRLPYNYFLINYSLQYAQSKYIINGDLDNYYNKNNILNHNISLQRYLYRDSNHKVLLYVSYTNKKTINKIDDIVLNSSSYTSEKIDIGINLLKILNTGYIYADFKYKKGLSKNNLKNENDDSIYDKYFDIFNFLLIVNKYLYHNDTFRIDFNTNIEATYTPNYLLNTNKFYVGDNYTVRGLQLNTVMWDYGGYAKNDLVFKLHTLPMVDFKIGVDIGYGRDRELINNDFLVGVSGSVDINYNNFNTYFTLARILKTGYDMVKEDITMYLGFNVKF